MPDYSNVKLRVDEVDLEELEDDEQKKKTFEETSLALKEMIKIKRHVKQWMQDLEDGTLKRVAPSKTIIREVNDHIELENEKWQRIDTKYTV